MRDFASSTTAGDFTKNTEEQSVERAIKTVTTATLSGVRPIERYKDEKTNTYYVLTKLNLEEMKNNLEQAKELNSQVRDYVKRTPINYSIGWRKKKTSGRRSKGSGLIDGPWLHLRGGIA